MHHLTIGDPESSQLAASEKPLPQTLDRQITLIIPANLPLPKFTFNQRLHCLSGGYSGFTGIVRGLEYLDHKTALAQGFKGKEDAGGWSYVLRLDEDDPEWLSNPAIICEEDHLEPSEGSHAQP